MEKKACYNPLMPRFLSLVERFDWTLLAAALALTSVGLVAMYGIGVSQNPPDFFSFYKQLVGLALGLIAVLVLTVLDYRHLRSFALILYGLGAILLALVLVLGHTVHSTQGWFRFGTLSFQPVEIAKFTLVFYLAILYGRRAQSRLSWSLFGIGFLATSAYAGLVIAQPDLGSAMVLFGCWGFISLFAGLPRRAWIVIPTVVIIGGVGLWLIGLKPYQRARIQTFLHPEMDQRGSGYNAIQARIAIGSGGVFGKGLGEGSQARLRFLPEAATDFMFAVIGEELGFVGVTVVLLLLALVIYRYLRIADESEDDTAALTLVGLGSIIVIHLTVNSGMNLGLLPITGIPMPFLSAAASNLVVLYTSVGLAESIAIRRTRT